MSNYVRGPQDARYDDDRHRVRCSCGDYGEASSGSSVIADGSGLETLDCMMDQSSVSLRSTARLSTLPFYFTHGICYIASRKWFRFAFDVLSEIQVHEQNATSRPRTTAVRVEFVSLHVILIMCYHPARCSCDDEKVRDVAQLGSVKVHVKAGHRSRSRRRTIVWSYLCTCTVVLQSNKN
jgi:hypothetical protein